MRPAPARSGALRAGLAALAVLAVVWTAVLIRDAHVGNDARLTAFSPISMTEVEHQFDRLGGAQFLNPDRHWTLVHLLLLQGRGLNARAIRAGEAYVRREPDNLTAWVVLRRASLGRSPRVVARADAAIRRLDPRSAEPGG